MAIYVTRGFTSNPLEMGDFQRNGLTRCLLGHRVRLIGIGNCRTTTESLLKHFRELLSEIAMAYRPFS
jgi:hypothetical protein